MFLTFRSLKTMNKLQIFGLLFVAIVAIYSISTVYAQTDDAAPTECTQDGSGAGHQRGSMDGSASQQQTQARDGSGVGGMYGNSSGDCIYS